MKLTTKSKLPSNNRAVSSRSKRSTRVERLQQRWWRQSGRENNSVCGVEVAPIPAESQPTNPLPHLARAKIQKESERESAPPASIASLYVSERAPGIILSLGSAFVCMGVARVAAAGARRRTHSHTQSQRTILHLDWQWKWNAACDCVRIWLRHWRTRRAGGRASHGK